jgi:Ser/Thr protein kinase RdoA (MazF antagonist)
MCEDPHGLLEEIARESPDALLDELGARALMSAPNVRWLAGVFARLRPFVEEARAYRRFLHNDVLPTNVMVGPDGAFAALIDWSDCGWGDPATDFVDTPARFLPLVLAGYREIGPIDGDASAEARILWDHLVRALRRLRREPMIGNVNWERPPFARPTELLAGAARIETWRRFLA